MPVLQPKRVLCLDWDKRSLRIVQAKVGGGRVNLEDAHAHRLPIDIDADDPEKMGRFIAHMLERHRIRHKRVIVDVPRDQAVINRLRLPPTPDAELSAAVRFQAQRELPFPLDQAEIDYVVAQRTDAGLANEVLLAGVRREVLQRLRSTCEQAGLTPMRIGLRPYANVTAVNHLPGMHDLCVLFVDVGPTMTEIDVVRGSSLLFSRAANVGVPFASGELVTDDSRVSSKAELGGLELSEAAEGEAVEELLLDVKRTLQAYRATEAEAAIDQIVIAGGTGVEHALLHAMDESFGLPVTLYDPTITLGVDEREAPKLRAFASPLGLAWGTAESSQQRLDFLNPKRPPAKHARLKRRLRIVGIAAVLLLAAVVYFVVTDRIAKNRELDQLLADNRVQKEDLLAYTEIDNRVQSFDDWDREARMTVMLDHLKALTSAAPDPGKELVVKDLNWRHAGARFVLKLACNTLATAHAFRDALNSIEVDGKRLYEAQLGSWQQTETFDPKFTGYVDVTVELLNVSALQAGEKDRNKSREKRVKDLKRELGPG